jgi:hypothetical protein
MFRSKEGQEFDAMKKAWTEYGPGPRMIRLLSQAKRPAYQEKRPAFCLSL